MMATETKESIRNLMREIRADLTMAWVREASVAVIDRVRRLQAFSDADVVGSYLAMPREVQTMDLVYASWDMGKRVCVPAWDERTGLYQMAAIERGHEMVSGPMGILQPRELRWVPLEEIGFMAVPGIAFDMQGGRLGHGGGHFDRLLVRCGGFKVGLAFDFQIVEQIPLGSHDIPVELVVTERMNYPVKGT